VNVENKPRAEKICAKLRDKVFADCHIFVDPEAFYEDCMYDVCACKGQLSHCSCPIFSAYASECARQGSVVEWRYRVSECGKLSFHMHEKKLHFSNAF
jgi:von Willebrand factor